MSRETELSDGSAGPARIDVIDVIVGIVKNASDQVLIGRRPAGKHMAGAWEFPGGKLEAGESARAGLQRELKEELDILVTAAEPLTELRHDYPDRSVRLDVWWVLRFDGCVRPREAQELKWIDADDLGSVDLLPADAPIVTAIRARLGSR